ncbi:uncharacterized protein [Periplaneta americana]|uniref:uncharacterized protein n=1 Tax=Periplaneta americana TaxID=6978 RepID=UPI0037E7A5F5
MRTRRSSRQARRLAQDAASSDDHASEVTTQDGHVPGLLDRDQRTALSRPRFDDMRAVLVTERHRHASPRCGCTRPSSQHHHKIKWHLLRRTLHRFSGFLVVCVCFLSVIRVPTVMSAPASRHGSPDRDRMNSHPKWINPCGPGASDEFDAELDIVPRLNDDELLTSIIVAAKNALMHAERFKESYAKETFNLDFKQLHQDWKSVQYSWLPTTEEISKSLGEHVPIEQLEKLELDSTLKDTYEYLQKFAVGLEQVVWDQKDENGAFKEQFADIEFKLRATLCEIQAAMMERGVVPHMDITRQIMNNDLRHIGNSSYRNVRDWVIFRDCMNGLEYVIQVFEYFKQKLTS